MSVSGLNRQQRQVARDLTVKAMLLVLHHAPEVHYTQGAQRWEGIADEDIAAWGQFPKHADCSATGTWAYWNGLHVPFGLGDVVNGLAWKAGFTGTLARNGRQVMHLKNVLRADGVLYGSGPNYEHFAVVVGRRKSDHKPLVVSHGSEAGPFLLPFDYRSDVGEIRRYI